MYEHFPKEKSNYRSVAQAIEALLFTNNPKSFFRRIS